MTTEQFETAIEGVLGELNKHGLGAADALVILGAAISSVARATPDPVRAARVMIDGLEGWIRIFQAEGPVPS